jgi:hypothetical protein
MNGFQRHGINHLSPSALNCWRETPGLWCLRYLAGVRDETNAAMHRGTSVERGLDAMLHGASPEDAHKFAINEFDRLFTGVLSDEIEAERELIPGMVKQCHKWRDDMKEAGALPDLAATQLRVETWLDGVDIPVIGYVDFTFMDGPDIDLKTTKRCPSEPSANHLRQVALYHKARQRPAALLYVTEKRFAFYAPPVSDLEAAIAELTSAGRSLELFLSMMPDAETALRALPHQNDHYAYGEAAKAKLVALQEAF